MDVKHHVYLLGSILLLLSLLSKKVVVGGHCLESFFLAINEHIKMAPIAAHLNAGVIPVVTIDIQSPSSHTSIHTPSPSLILYGCCGH